MAVCVHCGDETGITYGTIPSITGDVKLCHTGYKGRPDCYRRVTVYHEPLGILRDITPVPDGVEDIRDPGVTEILRLYRERG